MRCETIRPLIPPRKPTRRSLWCSWDPYTGKWQPTPSDSSPVSASSAPQKMIGCKNGDIGKWPPATPQMMCEPGQPTSSCRRVLPGGLAHHLRHFAQQTVGGKCHRVRNRFHGRLQLRSRLSGAESAKAASSGQRLVRWNQPTARNANPCPRFHQCVVSYSSPSS